MADERDEIRPESSAGEGTQISVASGGAEQIALAPLPDALPALPLKNTVLFPFLLSPLLVNTDRSRRLIDAVLLTPHRLLVCVAVKGEAPENPGPDDLYGVGTVMRIAKMMKFPDDSYRLLVQGVARVRLEGFVAESPYLLARIQRLAETGDPRSVETTALMRQIAQEFSALVSESPRLSDELQVLAQNVEDPSKLADLVGSNLGFDVAGKQRLLEELDVPARLKRVLDELARERDAAKVESEIREKVQSDIGKTQRDYMLRQQLEAIRQELGEAEDAETEVEKLRARIEAAQMPAEAHAQAKRELDRLAQMPPAAAEHAVIRTYLEWMVELPWSALSKDRLDPEEARRILDEDHYGLDKVKDRIVEYIAVLSLKKDLRGPILCFVGPPGTGKTSLGRSIARALGRQFQRISLGGIRDEAEIRGHRRTYVGALPGRIIEGLRKCGSRNPVMMLDEIDKLGADFRGDPSSALLEVLDPEQNRYFQDHYLDVPFDLSSVMFITTANIIDTIPPPLRDRMEILELPGYIEEEKLAIARRFLIPRQCAENGIKPEDVVIGDDALSAIIGRYTREAGLRNLEREIAKICRKVARRRAEGEAGQLTVRPGDLLSLLGPERFTSDLAERIGVPGVAVGLAWTPFGGEILFVEATRMPGGKSLTITGQLGDVMRESAIAALSYIRSRASSVGLDPDFFSKSDIHLHVPAGAIPKDGPSAGVTMATAIVSLLSGRPCRPETAMTGEITLRGKVLPVGGIKEKVLAARRAGIKTIIIPAENEKDLPEVPKDALADLTFRYAKTVDDVLEWALLPAQSLPGKHGARLARRAAADGNSGRRPRRGRAVASPSTS